MKTLSCEVTSEGSKNAVIRITGFLSKDIITAETLFELSDFKFPPKAFRVESVMFAIQEKAGCVLWWKTKDDLQMILPLESRGKFDFEPYQGVHSPKDFEGIAISTFGVIAPGKHFLLILDITKQ